MQYRPTAAELLSVVATVLDDAILPALPADLQHRARVSANLLRIVEREEQLGPANTQREHDLLAGLIGHDDDLVTLRSELTARLRVSDDDAFDAAAWDALVAITRDDLAIAKPGHDSWEGE